MHVLGFLAIGVAAGWLAGRLMHGRPFGLGGDLVVGVIGSLLGGYLFGLLGLAAYGTIGAFVTAVVGAMVFLYLLKVFRLRYP
ncbi:MAG TPA: GlsB/YeaQ/YmgE family stress response membrane protein [Elusimicrobiota bacterium]|jgi:uncharacterized membrane protein YeaQ/YmgE (transglycosylase-associated protein family)|nr:GlsB/YeaQ/YmgE family stress response membrane protein [Elusimicrobiota bacterium]